MKFKVGDKVICVTYRGEGDNSEERGGSGWEEGKIFIVIEIRRNIYFPIDGSGVHENYLELADSKKSKTKKKIKALTEKQLIVQGLKEFQIIGNKSIQRRIQTRKANIGYYKEDLKRAKKKLEELLKNKPKLLTSQELNKARECYCGTCRRKLIKHDDTSRIRRCKENIKAYNRYIKQNRVELKKLQKELLEPSATLKELKKDIVKLKKHPSFVGIEYDSTTKRFSFHTKPLYYQEQPIGNYLITLDLPSQNFYISNMIGQVKQAYDHWCVEFNRPCFGRWNAGINNCITKGQMYLLVDSLIVFLKSYSAGGFIQVDDWLYDFGEL